MGARTLLEGASAHIPQGQRVGLVGRNGTGKTTLFRILMGDRQPDGGSVTIRPRASITEVAQEAPDGDTPVLECVLEADRERTDLLRELEGEPSAARLAFIHERLAVIEAHSAPARAATILCGLGFPPATHDRPVGTFSGGWRMRVALARALFVRADILLLDEPTNHLDLEATLWLESFLASCPGTVLVISHDRELLNRAVNRILHLENGRLVSYAGNFDRFERTRAERQDHQARAIAKQAEERRHLQAFVDRFRAKATKARQAQSRLRRIEKLQPIAPVIDDRVVPFDFPDPDILPPPLVLLEDAVAGYDGVPVLKGLNLRIDMDDRIALLGANGNGKSTLAKILSGRLKPMEGSMRVPGKLRVGYFAQHQQDELREGESPLQHGLRLMGDLAEVRVRAHLARFGFDADRVRTPVGNLSGGEKARLLIALATRDAPHILVLDEPTNHLDIDARESLMRALNAFRGAVVLVSHDPRLVDMVADRLWLVDGGRVSPFDGDMDDYRRLLLDRARAARREEASESRERAEARASGGVSGGNSGDARARRRAAAEERTRLAPLRKKVEEAEKRVAGFEREKAALEAALADPALYEGPSDRAQELQKALGEVARSLAAAEDAWVQASEALEEAAAGSESDGA